MSAPSPPAGATATVDRPPSDDELAAFCRREHPRLVGALSLYCGEPQLAEELAADALVKAIDRWPRVREMAAPGAWVHRVAINLANSRLRRRAAERRATARLAGRSPDADRVEAPDAADALAVRRAVAALPARQRRCVVLRFYLDHDLADVAADLGISTQATAALTYRALRTLRAEIGEDRLALPDEERPDA